MSRSAAKSKAGKPGRSPSVQVTTPPIQDLDVEEFVPGRLTQAQWMDMLIQEDADETVGVIVEELLSKVMESCLRVYIKGQLATFSASWAKSYLTQILEQQILYLDEGEEPEESSKTEDSEPLPAVLDAWAQGCVPTVNATPEPQPVSQQEVDIGQVPEETELRVNQECTVVAQTNSPPKQSEKETSPKRSVIDKHYGVHSPRSSQKLDRKKTQINFSPKPVQSKLLPLLSCSSGKKDVEQEGKNRTHSVSNHMTRSLCQPKERLIPRLDPSSLPRHSIIPQYEILDNNCTKPISKRSSGLPKLEPRCNSQQAEWMLNTPRPPTSSKDRPERSQRRKEADIWLKKLSPSRHRKEGLVFSGPLRLDQMELAPGVSLPNPHTVDINSFRFNSPALSTMLRPIQSDVTVPVLSVEQLTKGPSPQVTPLFQSRSWDNE